MSNALQTASEFYATLAEYNRLTAAIDALDPLQAHYKRKGDAARREDVQCSIDPLLERAHELRDLLLLADEGS